MSITTTIKLWNWLKIFFMIPLITAILMSCSGTTTSPTPNDATLTSIAVTADNSSLPIGISQQYTATGTFTNGVTADISDLVNWTESGASIQISSTGVVVGSVAGSGVITASLNGVTSSTLLTITSAKIASIAVTAAKTSIAIGATQIFVATATNSDGTKLILISPNIAWSSSASNVANISSKGVVTGNSIGTTTITATYSAVGSAIVGSIILTVANVTPSSVVVNLSGGNGGNPNVACSSSTNPATAIPCTMPLGVASQQASAVVTFSDSSQQTIDASAMTWSSNSTAVAMISNLGVITPIANGTTEIFGSYTAGGVTIKSSVINLTVKAATLNSILVTPSAAVSLQIGGTLQSTIIGAYIPADGSSPMQFGLNGNTNINWSTDTPSSVTISTTGLAKAVMTGSSKIKASVGGVSGVSATITVTSIPLVSISISPSGTTTLHSAAGLQQQFTATGTYANGTTANLTNVVTWASNTNNVATIITDPAIQTSNSLPGLATIVGSTGNAQITATLGNVVSTPSTLSLDGITLSSIAVTANPAPGLAVLITPAVLPGLVGVSYPLKATATFSNSSTMDVTNFATWVSSVVTTAIVGNIPSPYITATGASLNGNKGIIYVATKGSGNTNIAATLNGISSPNFVVATGTAPTNTTLTAIAVSPVSTTATNILPAATGLSQQYKAIGTFTAGGASVAGMYDITNSAVWSSTDPVATALVGNNAATNTGPSLEDANAGLVYISTRPVATSTSIISYTPSGVTAGTATVTIGTATLASIAITPAPVSPATSLFMPANKTATMQLTAIGTYTGGTGAGTYNITQNGDWTSSVSAVGTIFNTAFVTNGGGIFTATATASAVNTSIGCLFNGVHATSIQITTQ